VDASLPIDDIHQQVCGQPELCQGAICTEQQVTGRRQTAVERTAGGHTQPRHLVGCRQASCLAVVVTRAQQQDSKTATDSVCELSAPHVLVPCCAVVTEREPRTDDALPPVPPCTCAAASRFWSVCWTPSSSVRRGSRLGSCGASRLTAHHSRSRKAVNTSLVDATGFWCSMLSSRWRCAAHTGL